MTESITHKHPPISEVIGSTEYPFEPASDPDLLARRIAKLAPELRGEIQTDVRTGAPILTTAAGGMGHPYIGVDIDLTPREGLFERSWRVIGSVDGVGIVLFLPRTPLSEADHARVITTLQVYGVLPGLSEK